MNSFLKKVGPGLLFAGAAVGVSHLVQSTKLGAQYGFGFLWILLLVALCKYPFFEFGTRYASATKKDLLKGYQNLGKPILITYAILTFLTMFTIQAAVTVVTAGLAKSIFNSDMPIVFWSFLILIICLGIALIGRYVILDKVIKNIVILLSISTIISVIVAFNSTTAVLDFGQNLAKTQPELLFLMAFMGWMPAPLDVSIWSSLWTIEKQKTNPDFSVKSAIFDFNIGYITTIFLAICFTALGAIMLHTQQIQLSSSATGFASQLIGMYQKNLGQVMAGVVAFAAFTTMFSTTLTSLDASSRAITKTSTLLKMPRVLKEYKFWIFLLSTGTMMILLFFSTKMGTLIKIATIISFVTAPFYAILNTLLVYGKDMPKTHRPKKIIVLWSIIGIIFLVGFSIWYLTGV